MFAVILSYIRPLEEVNEALPAHRDFLAEFYADLDYADDGGVIITREHEAKDPAAAAAKCLRAISEGKVTTVGGRDVRVGAETICVHSDTPNAVAIASAVRGAVPRQANRSQA